MFLTFVELLENFKIIQVFFLIPKSVWSIWIAVLRFPFPGFIYDCEFLHMFAIKLSLTALNI